MSCILSQLLVTGGQKARPQIHLLGALFRDQPLCLSPQAQSRGSKVKSGSAGQTEAMVAELFLPFCTSSALCPSQWLEGYFFPQPRIS